MHSWLKPLAIAIPIFVLGSMTLGCKKPEVVADAAPPEPEAAAPVADAAPEPVADASVEDAAPVKTVVVVPTGPLAAGQVWSGNYVCQGTGQMTLRITRVAGTSVSAVNEFVHHNGKAGSFNMSGTFTPATRQLNLAAGSFIKQPPGMSTVGLNGTISADGHNLAGFVVGTGCSTFNVHH